MVNTIVEIYGTNKIPEKNYCGFSRGLTPKFRADLEQVVAEHYKNNPRLDGFMLPASQEKPNKVKRFFDGFLQIFWGMGFDF